MTVDRIKLRREIIAKISRDAEVKRATKRQAEEVRDYIVTETAPAPWNPSPLTKTGPYATGDYAASIRVRQSRGRLGRFLAAWEVYTDHENANFIEYGTGPDKPGSRSPWGPFTPTPEFAPFGRAAHHFGGTAP